MQPMKYLHHMTCHMTSKMCTHHVHGMWQNATPVNVRVFVWGHLSCIQTTTSCTLMQSDLEIMYVCMFVGRCLATKVFIGKLLATREVWVIIG